jgi:tetratricopeptide (TPR) repeat protein
VREHQYCAFVRVGAWYLTDAQEGGVFSTESGLKHLPFFQELSQLREDAPAWHELTAGLVVLRLVDRWLEIGAPVVADDGWGLASVRSAVLEIDGGRPVRHVLDSMLDAMVRSERVDTRIVTPRLMAYAQALDFDARWNLSIDVYQTVLDYCDPAEDQDVLTTAYLQMAVAHRMLGDLDLARDYYARAGEVGESVGNLVGVLRAEIGFAKIAIARGNFPQAQQLLDSVIARSTEAGLSTVRSFALHDRSGIAHTTGDYELAIRFAYRALQDAGSPRDRDRIMADMAAAFKDLGLRTAARDGYLIIVASAQEQYLRWIAGLNLMEIAAMDGSETIFEAYRRDFSPMGLPPVMLVHYHYAAGQGYRRLGDFNTARTWLTRALTLAEEHGTNNLLFSIEEELECVRRADSSRPKPAVLTPDIEVQEIAAAMRSMREAVAVGR